MIKKNFFIIFILCSASSLYAQKLNQANKAVYIDANTGFSVINNSFTDTWSPSPALHVNIRFPFYIGQIETGMRYVRFNGMAPTQTDSDFHSFFIHLGYTYLFPVTSRYKIGPGIRFGNNFMIFNQTEVYTSGSFRYETDPVESEFAYEFALHNQFQINNHWLVNATISYNRTLTKFPLPLTLFSVGISYAFTQPKWLKHFLQ